MTGDDRGRPGMSGDHGDHGDGAGVTVGRRPERFKSVSWSVDLTVTNRLDYTFGPALRTQEFELCQGS